MDGLFPADLNWDLNKFIRRISPGDIIARRIQIYQRNLQGASAVIPNTSRQRIKDKLPRRFEQDPRVSGCHLAVIYKIINIGSAITSKKYCKYIVYFKSRRKKILKEEKVLTGTRIFIRSHTVTQFIPFYDLAKLFNI